jgi:DNA-directed RNA polymerase subunit omega
LSDPARTVWFSAVSCGELEFPLHSSRELCCPSTVRNDYLQSALLVIDDPNVLVNMVSRRVKQLKQGNRALVESLEKLAPEDIALREIAEKKISFEEASAADIIAGRR